MNSVNRLKMEKDSQINLRVQRRINTDLAELGKNITELNENGIYWHVDEDNIREIYIVITGQEGTPYAYAPFFFKFKYPDMYPLVPPEGKFCTSDGRTRFNPNLYVEGKICLSILGTWSGPSWTPVMTIKTVIMSISGLVMCSEPLRNEPGLETSRKQDIYEYNAVVEFRSLKVGLIDQLTNCPEIFHPMYEKMVDRFRKDFMKIMGRIVENESKYKVETIRPRYGAECKIDYPNLKTEMIELGKKFGLSYMTEIPKPIEVELTFEGKPITTKIPASNFELGLEIEYEGAKYKVMNYKNGKKYWKKIEIISI